MKMLLFLITIFTSNYLFSQTNKSYYCLGCNIDQLKKFAKNNNGSNFRTVIDSSQNIFYYFNSENFEYSAYIKNNVVNTLNVRPYSYDAFVNFVQRLEDDSNIPHHTKPMWVTKDLNGANVDVVIFRYAYPPYYDMVSFSYSK